MEIILKGIGCQLTEVEKVRWAIEHFVFTMKLSAIVENGMINHEIFRPSTNVIFSGEPLMTIPEWDGLTQAGLIDAVRNYQMMSIAGSSIAADNALSAKHGRSSQNLWQANPNDLNSLREILFLIRSAYAHTVPDVHWQIAGRRKTNIYSVETPDQIVEFDANGKHGAKLDFADFGGLKGYLSLLLYASDLLG